MFFVHSGGNIEDIDLECVDNKEYRVEAHNYVELRREVVERIILSF